MTRLAVSVWLFAPIILFYTLAAGAQDSPAHAVTTSDVIAMKQAGLSDDLVITKIRQSNQPANLSTDELVALKKQNVSDAVIKALMDPANATLANPSPPGATIANRILNVNPSGA